MINEITPKWTQQLSLDVQTQMSEFFFDGGKAVNMAKAKNGIQLFTVLHLQYAQ